MDIGGAGLTCSRVHAVAHGEARVTISGTDRARAAWTAAQRLTTVVYGRGTGVGANKDVPVEQGGAALLRSHACGAGPLVEPERARAMLVVRLNQLLAGGSGVDPGVLPVLAQAINDGFTPPVRTYGAIGTGDLTALATTALCLLGELPWHSPPTGTGTGTGTGAHRPCRRSPLCVGGRRCAAVHQLGRRHPRRRRTRLSPAAPAARRGRRRSRPLLLGCGRLRRAAGGGRTGGASPPRPGGRGRPAARPAPQGPSPRVQDPYGYRAFAQVHGAAMDALDRAEAVVETDLNAAAENPLIAGSLAWHNGNFHSAPVALALDALRAALVQVAQLSTARLATLMNPGFTGLLPFLADRPGGSGALILEYVAQDALAELRHLAAPVTTGTAVISLGTEDHAGFATQAARHALRCVEPLEIVLACEHTAATRALHGPKPDTPLTADLETARQALRGR